MVLKDGESSPHILMECLIFSQPLALKATEEQRGLDDRSQKSDVRLPYGITFPPNRHSGSVSRQ